MQDANSHGVDYRDRPLADEVLAYLVRHPEARDTMEGIMDWWLLEQRIRSAVADVEAALRYLVSHEFVTARRCRNGRTNYGLNRAKEREIQKHLRTRLAAHDSKPKSQA